MSTCTKGQGSALNVHGKSKDPGPTQCQAFCFFAACICLMLCSTGEPGTPFVLSFAVVGRLCLDVCFTTIYVALAQIFAGRASKVAFTTCETTARLGGIIAPLSGTWPASVPRLTQRAVLFFLSLNLYKLIHISPCCRQYVAPDQIQNGSQNVNVNLE